jgi:hypothetical protein
VNQALQSKSPLTQQAATALLFEKPRGSKKNVDKSKVLDGFFRPTSSLFVIVRRLTFSHAVVARGPIS